MNEISTGEFFVIELEPMAILLHRRKFIPFSLSLSLTHSLSPSLPPSLPLSLSLSVSLSLPSPSLTLCITLYSGTSCSHLPFSQLSPKKFLEQLQQSGGENPRLHWHPSGVQEDSSPVNVWFMQTESRQQCSVIWCCKATVIIIKLVTHRSRFGFYALYATSWRPASLDGANRIGLCSFARILHTSYIVLSSFCLLKHIETSSTVL